VAGILAVGLRKGEKGFDHSADALKSGAIRPSETLGGQVLSPLGSSTGQNLTTALGSHARAKAMTPFAHQHAGLIGAFHREFSINLPRHPAQTRKP